MQRRPELIGLLLIVLLPALLAALGIGSGRTLLPRHPGARDLPWAAGAAAGAAAGEPFNRATGEQLVLHEPDRRLLARALAEGRLPLWDPLTLGGVPFAASPIAGVFYPPNLAFALLPPEVVPMLGAAWHLALAGTAFLLFLRRAGLRPGAAFVGAAGFAFSGWMAARLQAPPLLAVMSWIPVGLFAIEAWHCRRARWSRPLLVLAVAMMWLAGFPQLAALGTLALVLHGGIAAFLSRDAAGPSRVRAALSGLVLPIALGVLVAAVQLVPALELVAHADRALVRGEDDLAGERYRGPAFVGLLLPRLLGDPMRDGPWQDDVALRTLVGEGPSLAVPHVAHWCERTLYAGPILLGLAVAGAFARRRLAASALVLLGAGLVLACGAPAIALARHVPGFGLGAPARAVALVALALPILAALGVERILSGPTVARGLRWAAAAALALAGLALAAFAFGEAAVTDAAAQALKDAGFERRFGIEAPRPAAAYRPALLPAARALRADLVQATLALAALVIVLSPRVRPPAKAALLGGLLVLDLGAFLLEVNRPVTRERLFEETPALAFLAAHLGDGRIARVSEDEARALEDAHRLFPPGLPAIAGIRDAQGKRDLVPSWPLHLWEGVSARTASFACAGIAAADAGSPVLDLFRVRYLVAARPQPALTAPAVHPEGSATDADLFIYENEGALPVAFLVHRHQVLDPAAAAAAIRSGALAIADEVALEAVPPFDPAPPPAAEAERVTVRRFEAETLEIEVIAAAPAILVVTESWHPGWKASIDDGKGRVVDAPVRRADAGFRAVAVPAGRSLVQMRFRPASLGAGALASTVALVATLLFFVRRRPVGNVPDLPVKAGR